MTKKAFPSADRASSGPSAARIEIPRARNVEIKAFLTQLTQRRVLKGRHVYPCHLEVLKNALSLPQWGLFEPCGGLQLAPAARGTNEASRRAENTLTGHTTLFYFLTRLRLDVPVSPGCFCAYVFFLLLVCQRPSISQGYAGFDHYHAFTGLGLPPFVGSPPFAGFPQASRPSRASCPLPSCPSRAACFSLASRPLPFASLVSFERFAPCSEIL